MRRLRPPHAREPELTRTLKKRGRAARWVLPTQLGYAHVRTDDVRMADRLIAGWHGGRTREEFPPWMGQGRLLDVGCVSGRFSTDVFVGDPVDADFTPGAFDVITSFHVIEHLPRPLETLRRMLTWLAPGGLIMVEVPNAAGAGGRLFERY